MEEKKSIEFFMILTNRTVYLAKYTIKSYLKVFKALSSKYNIKLKVYLNCINIDKYEKEISKWNKYKFIELIHSKNKNSDFQWTESKYILKSNGQIYLHPMERMPEIQDKEYSSFESDYFVTVDDDLEILNPEFIQKMIELMETNPLLGVISTNKTKTHERFDDFSNCKIVAQERNDTWFCMYKKESKVRNMSMELLDKFISDSGKEYIWYPINGVDGWDEYFEHVLNESGIRYVWDGGALLQEKIRENFPSKIIALSDVDKEYENQFIHYAAFGKNKSVNTPLKIAIYRFFAIKGKVGIIYFSPLLNKYIKKFYNKIFRLLFSKAMNERLRPAQLSKLD